MKIKSIDITGVGGLGALRVDFDESMNLISGPNGIGKTTLLECVAHAFTASGSNILRRSVSHEIGSFRVEIENDGQLQNAEIFVADFLPSVYSNFNGIYSLSSKLLSLKVNRTLTYQALDSVGKDTHKDISSSYNEAKSGVNIHEVKNWFVNRYLYSAHPQALTDEQISNFALAKKSFSILSAGFSFSRVLASSNEIMVNSPGGEIYYEYLSSGFKSCLSIIFGIIKDIEFRFKQPHMKAEDFDGIILIDELELHLHPEWQSKISRILVEIFPKVQFIASTHSPHVLQNAKPNEIIALAFDGGQVYKRDLPEGAYGFQGWTVEEILTDVMGMADTRTQVYQDQIAKFESYVDSERHHEAELVYEELDKLLHPDNYLRKLLKFQLASIKEGVK